MIAGATGQTYAITPGAGNYTVEVANGAGCTATSNSFVAVSTGVQNLSDFANSISIYPNPARETFNLAVSAELTGTNYAVYDLTGRMLLTGKTENEVNTISVRDLSPGIYLVSVFDSTSSVTKRLAVQK